MKLSELPDDGELTREMIRDYGEALTFKEKLAQKNYGLGRLSLRDGHPALVKFYLEENNSIRTHFEWTKKGAVIRMRSLRKQYALGLTDDEIERITITKRADYVNPIPLMPFWILLKLGVATTIARRFKIRYSEFRHGPIIIDFALNDQPKLVYETRGEAWSHCLSTFGIEKTQGKVTIVDHRIK